MNIIARAAIFIYDGSPISPVYPAKAGKPSDDAGEYLSSVAEKLMGMEDDAMFAPMISLMVSLSRILGEEGKM